MSPETITKCLIAYKNQFKGKNIYGAHEYITFEHDSKTIEVVIDTLKKAKEEKGETERERKYGIILSIIEPLIVND